MGYRNYLGSLPKKEYNKIKNLTINELFEHNGKKWSDNSDDMDSLRVYDIAYNRHYELGKYVDEFPKGLFKPVFKNKETQKYFTNEQDFYVVQPEFVLHLIEHYTKLVKDYYKKLLNDFYDGNKSKAEFMISKNYPITEQEMTSIYVLINHVREMANEWGVAGFFEDTLPYNTNLDNSNIVSSWSYEYEIFELVRLYKAFDWKRNIMVYYGY